jgi:hypothetical protein
MKTTLSLLCAGLALWLAGCVSHSVTVPPVGPNPNGVQTASSVGFLQVLSRERTRSDDQNQAGDGEPVWHQHTNYRIYDLQGHLVKRVDNAVGHYAQAAELVSLRPGKYVINAPAKDYPWIQVMVTIEPGRTTRVHLDDKWTPPANTAQGEIVTMPDGNPVGWHN